MIGINARMWRVRPSRLLTISDPVVALALDDAVATRMLVAQTQRQRRSKTDPEVLAAGYRYETPADLPGFDADYQRQLNERVH